MKAIYVGTVSVFYHAQERNPTFFKAVFASKDEVLNWMDKTKERQEKLGSTTNVYTCFDRLPIDPDELESYTKNYSVRIERTVTQEIWIEVEHMENREEAERRAEQRAEDTAWNNDRRVDETGEKFAIIQTFSERT